MLTSATNTNAVGSGREPKLLAPHEARAATEAQRLCRLLERAARLSRTAAPIHHTTLAKAG